MLRSANLKTCPKCNMAKWDAKNNVCTLPSSAAATNFQKDIKLVGMAAGAVASVAITIATAGTAGLTIGGYIILGVETTGAGLELWSQSKINKLSDEFFLKSNNCHSENCAGQLIETYLTDLAAIDRDLTADEADAVDKEMARLFELIPTDSNWWIDNLRADDGTSFLEKADNGHWTAAQVWRAIGIGMQFAGVASSVTGWIIKKTPFLEKTLDRTSRILLNNAEIAEKNIVKFENLSDVDKEFYKLWKTYAPKNQTFEQFKAMSNGNLDEMRQMTKGWRARNERDFAAEIEIADIRGKIDQFYYKRWLEGKYSPTDANTINDFNRLRYLEENRVVNYATYDPEFSKISKPYEQEMEKLNAWYDQEWNRIYNNHIQNNLPGKYSETDEYKNFMQQYREKRKDISGRYQYQIAEQFPLENLGNVVNERATDFTEVIKNNPNIASNLNDFTWGLKDDNERLDIAQQILDEYARKTNTPIIKVEFGDNMVFAGVWNGEKIKINPNSDFFKSPRGMLNMLAHEHGHAIDELVPNEGALGEQFSHYAEKLYSNAEDAGYRVALTEQSSYKLESGVTKEAMGKGFYTTEWDLRDAEIARDNLEQENAVLKSVFEKELEETKEGVNMGVGIGVVVGGGTIGSAKQITENQERKNIFQKYNEEKGTKNDYSK